MQKMNCRLLTYTKTKDRDHPRNTKLHTTVGLGCLYNNFFNFQEFFLFRSSKLACLMGLICKLLVKCLPESHLFT